MRKYKNIIEALKNAPEPFEPPFEVWVALFDTRKNVHIVGTDVCIGDGDYISLEQAQKSLDWYVNLLGGTVTWSTNSTTKVPKKS